jgi:putative intracellular protease/amidase
MGQAVVPESMSAAVLLYEGCTITEVAEIATRLANWGVRVQFVASSVEQLRDQSGLRMLPDLALGEVDPAGLTVVLVPGGNPDRAKDDPALLGWLRGADEAGVLVAAICAGVALVASAGLVAGRRITHNCRSPWAPPGLAETVEHLWTDALVEQDRTVGVVRDGNLVSALPNAPVEFAMEILVAVGLYDRRRAELMGAHLRGGYVEQLYLDG